MRSVDKRNIKVRATCELNIFPNKKSKKTSVKEKRGMSMYVSKPKEARSDVREPLSFNSQHRTHSCTAQRNSIRLKNITQIKVSL